MHPIPSALRVLVVFEYGTLNGGENSLLALIEPLRSLGVEIHALAPPDTALAGQLEAVGAPQFPLPSRTNASRKDQPNQGADTNDVQASDLVLSSAIQQAAKRFEIQLIHSNSLSMSRRVGRLGDALHWPCIGHLRDIMGLSRKAIADLNRNQRLLAVSQATKDFHVAQGLQQDRCFVAYNGVDLARFRPQSNSSLRDALEVPREAFLFAAIGQIGMRKGWDVLLRSFQALLSLHPETHLLAIGERHSQKQEAIDYENDLRAYAELPKLAGKVHFLGRRSDLPQLLAASDALVHAARQEPLGRVLLEAASMGLPIVATRVGGTEEILRQEVSGLLCPANDDARLAEAMIRLRGDAELRVRLGAAARELATKRFSMHTAAETLAGHYREVFQQQQA